MRVRIVYCRRCGYQDRALELARDIITFFDDVWVELVPGDNGVFDVFVNGELVHSRFQTRRFFDSEEILSEVGRRRAALRGYK
ncbi:MAG: Rdx family protein [Sulfolobales archaeon]|nr:Rdx family protein [Sulfolobales archaeon]MCG2910841.1 Rdx family protein [Sulfolobales archaeon]